MPEPPRTVVTFRSDAFNTTEPREYFINPCCFGDDVARWLIGELRSRGAEPDAEPGQEDFGWYLNFAHQGSPHTLVLAYREGDESDPGDWVGILERNCGFVASLLGGRNRGVQPEAAQLLHSVLSGADRVREVRWHRRPDFDRGREELGTPVP